MKLPRPSLALVPALAPPLALVPALALVLVLALVASGAAPSAAGAAPLRGAALAAAARSSAAPTSDHDCVVPGSGTPRVAWSRLTNPILSYPDAGAKDEAIVWDRGRWHMVFSYMTHGAGGRVHWDIATATSADLVHWSNPDPWPEQSGALGVASPDIVRSPGGRFVVTYQSNPSAAGQDKIYYRTSADLVHWSRPRPLASALARGAGQRQIDAAVAYTGHGLILGYKASSGDSAQHFVIAWSPSGSLGGPWTLVGRPDISLYGDTVENYEFVGVGGHWDLVATSNTLDQPWIFHLAGNPRDPSSWLHWTGGRQLSVPAQAWNSGPGIQSVNFVQANSAFLCVAGGYSYLLYAGSNELSQFAGWGHAEIGIARSTDLVHWDVPPTG